MKLCIIVSLLLLVIVATAILIKHDSKKMKDNEKNRYLEENDFDNACKGNCELKPQESLEYILNIYFSDKNYNLNFFNTYKRLLEKACEISYDVKNRDMYQELVTLFFHGCVNFEKAEPQKLFNLDYGEIDANKIAAL